MYCSSEAAPTSAVMCSSAKLRAADTDRYREDYKISTYYVHKTNEEQMQKYPNRNVFSPHVSVLISSPSLGLLIHL